MATNRAGRINSALEEIRGIVADLIDEIDAEAENRDSDTPENDFDPRKLAERAGERRLTIY
jgi:hypothetical protein